MPGRPLSNWAACFPDFQGLKNDRFNIRSLFHSLGVAGVAGLAVVNITGHMVVYPIHSTLAVGMTVDAGKHIVIGGKVTIGAGSTGMGT